MITYPKCGECSDTFILLYDALIRAGWVREGPPVGVPIGAMQSILVNVSDEADDHTKRAAQALVTSLDHKGIAATLENDTTNKAIVDIIIGLKPPAV